MASPIRRPHVSTLRLPPLFLIAAATLAAGDPAPSDPRTPVVDATIAESRPEASAPRRVTNVWVDTPLSQVLRDISMQVKATIALDPSVKDSVVSMEAEGLSLPECLEKLATGQGLTIRKVDDTFIIVGNGKPGSPTFPQMTNSRLVSLKYVSADHLLSILPPDFHPYVTRGKRATEVFVCAPPEMLDQVISIMDQIDVPRQQVVLEALVVELVKTKGSEFGVDWQYTGHQASFGLASGPELFTGVARYASIAQQDYKDFFVKLDMLVSDGKASIRSRPRVATLNGEPATIDMRLEEYFTIVTDVSGAVLRTQLQVVKSGVLLKMTPQVGSNGDITVEVSTEVSDVAAQANRMNRTERSGGDLPVVRRRTAETIVQVKDGDAIVIGGLTESQDSDVVRRVPVLGSIPLVGAIFRRTVKSSGEKEVLILITPRVMHSTSTAGETANSMLNPEKEQAVLRREETATASGAPAGTAKP